MSFYEMKVEKHDYFYFNHTKKDTETPPHFHGAIELLFCVNGNQDVCIGGETYTISRGCGCFIDSYTIHSLKPSGAELYAVVGDDHFFNQLFSAFNDTTPPRVFKFEDFDFISFLYTIHNKKRLNKESADATSGAIVKLLLAELYETFQFVKRKRDKQNELVAAVLQYASENYKEDLSLAALSSRFGYSHTYLSRILHLYLGMHWSVYVGNLRARIAHTLIEGNKNSSVLDVALGCGFESLNTFYRAYRRVFGKTPLSK